MTDDVRSGYPIFAGAVLLAIGLYMIVSGRFILRDSEVSGKWVRIAGGVLLVPLPAFFAFGNLFLSISRSSPEALPLGAVPSLSSIVGGGLCVLAAAIAGYLLLRARQDRVAEKGPRTMDKQTGKDL